MRKTIFPICRDIQFGKRNYFDCYEAAVGGLLQYHLNDSIDVKSLYCLFDAVCLSIDQQQGIYLHSRIPDINYIILQILGFDPLSFTNVSELLKSNNADPFIIDFDEYYFEGYHNFRKTHFRHASIATEVINPYSIKILDPVLEFLGDSCCVEKILSIPGYLEDANALDFIILTDKNKNATHGKILNYEQLKISISKNNIEFWQGKKFNNDDQLYYFGIAAFDKFTELFTNATHNVFSTEFYKWIYPLVWKEEYFTKIDNPQSLLISSHLKDLINEMEQLEVILLRLKSSNNARLHKSAIIRWDNIVSKIHKYIKLENERIEQNM